MRPVTRRGATEERRPWMNGISPVRKQRDIQCAPGRLAGDTRTVARNLALCTDGTGSAALRSSGSFLRFAPPRVNACYKPLFASRICRAKPPANQNPAPQSSTQPHAAFAAASPFSKLTMPFFASTRTTSLGPNRPSRICFASGFSICAWIARFRGRAP